MIRLGTSSWTAEGWERAFYPPRLPKRDYITFYASQFDTVEIDATFYAIPSRKTVEGWRDRTPEGFVFTAKMPQAITHEKILVDCDSELNAFIETMQILGDKLGPLLFQFRYFRKGEFEVADFAERLHKVLAAVAGRVRCAVEVRNKQWLCDPLLTTLREHSAALALIDHPYMPSSREYAKRGTDLLTADFSYVRWLGDRIRTEELIAKALGEVTFEQSVLDRDSELGHWADLIRRLGQEGQETFAYFNNHFSGFAPADVEKMRKLLETV